MPSPRFLVIDTSGRRSYPEEALEKLSGLNVTLESRPAPEGENWMADCREAEVLLVTAARISREVLDALPRLRGIVRYGVGLDRIDLESARERGVDVRNVPGFCVDEMADHALSFLLALSRDLVPANHRVRAGRWTEEPRKRLRLRGQTLGLVGLGDIGRAVAGRAAAFGLRVLAHDPFAEPPPPGSEIHLCDRLEDLFRQSDWISLHCALTPQTRAMIREETLALMKPGVGIINTARGELIDEPALVAALERGHVAAAGLDVLRREPPPPDHPLLGLDNVLLTPHIGWYSETACRELEVRAFEQLAAILRSHHSILQRKESG